MPQELLETEGMRSKKLEEEIQSVRPGVSPLPPCSSSCILACFLTDEQARDKISSLEVELRRREIDQTRAKEDEVAGGEEAGGGGAEEAAGCADVSLAGADLRESSGGTDWILIA
eukprot:75923-Hanusia_phi.AAC.1